MRCLAAWVLLPVLLVGFVVGLLWIALEAGIAGAKEWWNS